MEKQPLAKCNNCGNLWVDENPKVGQKLFELREGYTKLASISEELDPNVFWGCPICKTDAYLCDFEGEIEEISENPIKYAEKK